jgi:hypothetical protein
VLWQGHPLTDGMGEVVGDIMSGRYDLKEMKKSLISRDQLNQYLIFARMKDAKAPIVGKILYRIRRNDAAGLLELAFKIASDPGISDDQRDVQLANAALDRSEQLTSTNATDIGVTRAMLLFQSGDQQAGLLQARDTLKFAQGQAAKDEAQACIDAMEVRMAALQTNHIASPNGTNQAVAPPAAGQTSSLAGKP